ncbi:MAG: DNA mismatch repair endonuclease MutL, partial [Haloferacaceae archaeon]
PASVVKELVENSLDADASRISVAVEAGGTEGIRVRDDGVGMTADQLSVAVEEHTTSKISDIEDLEAGVATLGFRGEALHTVGAVSRLTIRSRPRGAGDAGAEITVEGGDVGEVRPAGCPEGTTVEVADLFFNTPARRKFLKTDATEFDHVNAVVTHYALANPDVAISLEHDGREVFATQGDGDLRSAVLSVYGREVAEAMVEVRQPEATDDADEEAPTLDGPVDAVRGLVSHPETTRSSRDYLSTFVNGRYVTASALREAILGAYGGQLANDRYPFAVLFVDVPADEVDVNVHPRKMEVRFDHEPGVRAAVEGAVEDALLEHGLVRSSAPRGRSRAAETEVRPDSTQQEVGGGAGGGADAGGQDDGQATPEQAAAETAAESAAETAAESAAESAAEADATDGATPGATGADASDPHDGTTEDRPSPRPWQEGPDEATEEGSAGEDRRQSSDPFPDRENLSDAPQSSFQGSAIADDDAETRTGTGPESVEFEADAADPSESADTADPSESADTADPSDGSDAAAPNEGAAAMGAFSGFDAPTSQRTLGGEAATIDREFETIPHLRVLGQLHDTYIVAETADGMVLIDQHAADERVNYERLRAEVAGDTPTQALADPVELELTAREAELFEQYRDALAQVGFHANRTGERTVEVRTVPAVFDAALDPELLRDALSGFVADEADGGQATVDAVADSLLADLACYPSITGNTSLREGSVADLLAALDDCENPFACPHGRPVIVGFDSDEIQDRFERDYPGHGGRREE